MTCNQRSIPRVAILGAGMIAHRHVDRWKQAGAEVVAVADIDKEVLRAFEIIAAAARAAATSQR